MRSKRPNGGLDELYQGGDGDDDDDDDDDDDGAGENRAIYSSTVLFRFDNGASRTVSQITGPMVETAWREAVGRGRTTRFKILSPHALAIGICAVSINACADIGQVYFCWSLPMCGGIVRWN